MFPGTPPLYEGLSSASLFIWFSCFAGFVIFFMCVFSLCVTEVKEIARTAQSHF